MARGRIISSTLGESRKYAALQTDIARVAYVLILANTDRKGRVEADPLYLTRKVCTRLPYDMDDLAAALDEMERVGLIVRYQAKGVPVLQIVDFEKHNKPHHKEPDSRLPGPEDSVTDAKTQGQAKHEPIMDSSMNQAQTMLDPKNADKRSKEKKRKGKEREDPPPPSSEERMARAFDTGKPQANEEHRVRSEVTRLAGRDFTRKYAGDLPSWTRWTNDQLRLLWDKSDPTKWPGERDKKRAWIFYDLLQQDRPAYGLHDTPTTQYESTADMRARIERELGVN